MTDTPAETIKDAATAIKQAADRLRAAEPVPPPDELADVALAVDRALETLYAAVANVAATLAHYPVTRLRTGTGTGTGPAEVVDAALDHGETVRAGLYQARRGAQGIATECLRLTLTPPDTEQPETAAGEPGD